jgi:hypothetical protein
MALPSDPRPAHPRATAIRSMLVLEVASQIMLDRAYPAHQADVQLRAVSDADPVLTMASRAGQSVFAQVADGRLAMGFANPSAMLTMAVRGIEPFARPLPLRAVTVLPSADQLVFAIRGDLNVSCLEEVAERRIPLRISVRGDRDHAVHAVLAHVLRACGFSYADVASWGGQVRFDPGMPSTPQRMGAAEAGSVDAVFDEGAQSWIGRAVAAGMRVAGLREETIASLEQTGLRRAVLTGEQCPALATDVPTIDFSGWPLYVRADASADIVRRVCAALEARKGSIAWHGAGPLPLHAMCADGPATPLDVPLHDTAAAFWHERGYC